MPKQSRQTMVLKAFRFPPKLWADVEHECEEADINPSDAAREALAAWVAERRKDREG